MGATNNVKKAIVYCSLFLSMPLAIVIFAVIHRGPTFEGKRVTEWFREMKMGQPSPALTAFQRMGRAGMPPLQKALQSGQYSEKVKAAWALGQLGPVASNAIPDLVQCLDTGLGGLDIFAMQSLERIAPAQVDAIPQLLAKLGDRDLGVSNTAADLLNKVERDRRARNLWTNSDEYGYDLAFLNASSQRVRLFGLLRLMHFSHPDERVAATFQTLLTDTNDMIRGQTALFFKTGRAEFTDASVPVNDQPWR